MKDNGSIPRPGVGCPPSEGATTVETEVVDEREQYYQPPAAAGDFQVGRVRFDRSTTLESPCFWALIGVLAGAGLTYMILREKNR